ncbi:Uma2 family endonuclease [Leptolyngbya sp. FACHB-711]|uniref:Uma2 family endonuclease n=1 Tax=unclassified Leptolyngbya TaxID=2650499 RepID=UPI0016834DBB|nr:Uma2 family endonuclease [Leptolyngbya sp. FACHB-711]MBD1852079.1 Uma2 family endonuclease [Cyanobacteria bacterium FACHB-502]MBD2026566.1 Uma2 family endonuclease [Leptolyngbya sp. FACHB-711]
MVDRLTQDSKIPPLENGDRLTRFEFERRYSAMPQLKKAELIEGIVYMPAALRFRSHGQPHSWIMGWLTNYAAVTPGVLTGDAPTVRLDLDNEPQPDAVLLIDEAFGGQSRLSEDDYIEGAPELVIEIAASSAAIDLHAKKTAYRRTGVQEYIVWQVLERKLDWFYLSEGDYLSLPVDADGMIKSQVFPGLWLAVEALLSGDLQQVLAVVQQGTRLPEHAAFVQKLARFPH